MKRRSFLGLGAMLFLGCQTKNKQTMRVGASAGNFELGHRLRNGDFPEPTQTIETKVLIIGAGVSGLNAARTLQQRGIKDYLLLDLEQEVGGNARAKNNGTLSYPLGAHYLPIPNIRDKPLLDFLTESGVIIGRDETGLPIYEPTYLCFAPHERLFINGHWQDGLIPSYNVPKEDKSQIDRFLLFTAELANAKGVDGLYAFDLPSKNSSKDPKYTDLKRETMAQWMDRHQYTSHYLRWFVQYCCLDDYGMGIDQVAAWAGLHYFAARKGQGSQIAASSVLTWPQGNAFLVNKLAAQSQENIRIGQLAFEVIEKDQYVYTKVFDTVSATTILYKSEKLILAVPQSICNRLLKTQTTQSKNEYAPWVVAQIMLSKHKNGTGAPLSWDNVIYEAKMLGYIHSQQQSVSQAKEETHITCYYCVNHLPPKDARKWLRAQTKQQLAAYFIAELEIAHNDIAENIISIDLHTWGHGMVGPSPQTLSQLPESVISARIHIAHSDLYGISLFEEAFHAGRSAALWV